MGLENSEDVTDMPEKDTEVLTQHEKDLRMIDRFRLMDDDFFSEALDGRIEAVQFILRVILENPTLRVISTRAQVEYRSATARSIKLDVQAVTEEGHVMDVEIQRADRGTGARRARFHSSMLDRSLLAKGEDFEDLTDTYVIFITENDKFGKGLPLYHIDRKVSELEDALFCDGSHIIYVNGAFRNMDHPVGQLMHDFQCCRADDMVSNELAG